MNGTGPERRHPFPIGRPHADHPVVGRSLRNYAILSGSPSIVEQLQLNVQDRFWSRYYWLARCAKEWQAAAGFDAGLEQQLCQLLETEAIDYDSLAEVDAAVARDAVAVRRQSSADHGVSE